MRNLAVANHSAYPNGNAYPQRPLQAVRPGRRVSKLALYVFLLLLAFNTLNIGSIFRLLFRGDTWEDRFPVNPIMFVVLAIPIVVLTKNPRMRVTYFHGAWLFWIVYTLGGFLGPDQITFLSPYRLAQGIIKIWISIIGFPWLAFRVIDEANLVKYMRVLCILIGVGAVFSIVQMLNPQMYQEITRGGGRGAGLWIDPNVGATMCACGLLLSLMFPFRLIVANVGLRVLLVCGMGSTLSRAGILACLLSLLLYGILLRRWTAILKTAFFTIMLGIGVILALEPLTQSHIEGLAKRAEGIQQMLQGGVKTQMLQGRWGLWQQGFNYAAKNWIRGRGHGSMNYAIKIAYLESEGRWHAAGPHNYYIFVLGNSGIAALFALLLFMANMVWIGFRSQVTRVRAGLISLVLVFALLACSDHSMFAFQFFGAIFGAFALAGHHARKREPHRIPTTPQLAPGHAMT